MSGTFCGRYRRPPIAVPGVPPTCPVPPGHKPGCSPEQKFVDSKLANESYARVGQKTMMGIFTLKNGYEFVTSYSYAKKENFDAEVAQSQCRKKASLKIWDLYSFAAQEATSTIDKDHIDTGDIPCGPLRPPEEIIAEEEARDVLKQNIRTASKLVEKDYTPESWTAMQTALTAAKEACASYSSTAEDLTTANENLVDAMSELVPVTTPENPSEPVTPEMY